MKRELAGARGPEAGVRVHGGSVAECSDSLYRSDHRLDLSVGNSEPCPVLARWARTGLFLGLACTCRRPEGFLLME